MARYKTFDSTGVAPNGRLYAGDLNAIQDFLAKASDFAQTIDTGVLRVGDSAIQLLKFGTAEARITGALRTDGILRGLGGLYGGQFTTAGRPGAGARPTGLVIFNTDTNRWEQNVGTDASPNWQPFLMSADVIQLPLGGMIDYAGSADFSATLVLADGRPINRTTYAALFALLGTSYGPGDGSTTFNIPDARGRVTVGPDNMGTAQGAAGRLTTSNKNRGQSGGEEFHPLIVGEVPGHTHTVNSHSHGANTGLTNIDHSHYTFWNRVTTANFAGSNNAVTGLSDYPSGAFNSLSSPAGAGGPFQHQHSITAESPGTNAGDLTGGASPNHNNMEPYQVSNKLIRIA